MQPQNVKLPFIVQAIAISLLVLVPGCSQSDSPQTTAESPNQATSPSTPSPSPPSSSTPSPLSDPFPEAMDIAMSAATITQSAISPDDWKLVAKQWQSAIALLTSVPTSHPKKQLATQKITEYQRNLAYAQQQAVRSAQPKPSPTSPVASQPMANPAQRTPTTTAATSSPPQTTTPSQPAAASPSPETPTPSQPAPPTTVSANIALAQHLKQVGAKMYEAYWCSVCRWQEKQFGAEAYQYVTAIECDPRGKNAQPELCRQASIRAFPTWEINGQLYEGGMPLERLANLSSYQGSRNFTD